MWQWSSEYVCQDVAKFWERFEGKIRHECEVKGWTKLKCKGCRKLPHRFHHRSRLFIFLSLLLFISPFLLPSLFPILFLSPLFLLFFSTRTLGHPVQVKLLSSENLWWFQPATYLNISGVIALFSNFPERIEGQISLPCLSFLQFILAWCLFVIVKRRKV